MEVMTKSDGSSTNMLTKKHSSSGVMSVGVFKKRMLLWPNPVEYVNNMYGCHPGENDSEYFQTIFSNDSQQ